MQICPPAWHIPSAKGRAWRSSYHYMRESQVIARPPRASSRTSETHPWLQSPPEVPRYPYAHHTLPTVPDIPRPCRCHATPQCVQCHILCPPSRRVVLTGGSIQPPGHPCHARGHESNQRCVVVRTSKTTGVHRCGTHRYSRHHVVHVPGLLTHTPMPNARG